MALKTKFSILSALPSMMPYTLLKLEAGGDLSLAQLLQIEITTLRIENSDTRKICTSTIILDPNTQIISNLHSHYSDDFVIDRI